MVVGRVNYLLRTLVLGGVVGLGYLAWLQLQQLLGVHEQQLAQREERIVELTGELAVSEERVGELEMALRYLKIDHRLARLTVLGQSKNAGGEVETTVRFEELGPDGRAIGQPAEATLPGKVAYIESLVIKFSDDYVEQGDVWRGTSLCLFRRVFTERQSPDQGLPLDEVGAQPLPYSDDRDPDIVSRLWLRFWDYANDPEAAAAAGVRAIHGEAPFIELREGKSYSVELRASGGLSIRAE